MTPSAHESLQGSIERVTFHNSDSGFCVLKVVVAGKKDLVTVVGSSISVTAGEYLQCKGAWQHDKNHGMQFKATQVNIIQPSSLEGIEKYLGSCLIKGVGPGYAKRLVAAFGIDVFKIIDEYPERLKELSGLGEKRILRILESWSDQKNIRKLVMFLHQQGVGTARAVRIYKIYGSNAIQKIQENPYCLALDVRGIGFKTADLIAEKLGMEKTSLLRACAGVRHWLQEYSNLGHCAVEASMLLAEAAQLLEIPEEIIQVAIAHELQAGHLIQENRDGGSLIFLAAFYQAELGIVERLKRLLKSPLPWKKINTESAIHELEVHDKRILSVSQRVAVRNALTEKVVIITGGPGVGKTTVINSILQILKKNKLRIQLCAPTGRAAKRLSESTHIEAKTLHRLLEYEGHKQGFRRNNKNPLEADVVVIDEMSMVDVMMMNHLLKAIPLNSALIMVGDVDQLPSVGPGAVLRNLIDSNKISTTSLKEIFRQAASSKIIINAHKINQGIIPYLKNDPDKLTDFYFIKADTPEEILAKLLQVVGLRIPKRFQFDPIRDIQVLTPMNRALLGAHSLNSELKAILNPEKRGVLRFGTFFSVADKVIQTVNNYDKEVFNGDIGFIESIDEEEQSLLINFDDKLVNYEFSELDEIQLAYAITIHKAQGSEYSVVVLPLAMQHFTLLERNLIYTGVTRGKSLVVVIGQTQALAMGIKNEKNRKRKTALQERLEETLN